MAHNCITYHLDQAGRIINLSNKWEEFAIANHAMHLTTDNVINQSIFDFITDEKCLYIYEILIEQVQRKKEALRFPFRCDAPDLRRYMEMNIFHVENDVIGFKSCVLKEEARPYIKLLDPTADKLERFVTMCSWCKSIKITENQWMEIEQAIIHLELFEQASTPQLTHGICSACYEAMVGDL